MVTTEPISIDGLSADDDLRASTLRAPRRRHASPMASRASVTVTARSAPSVSTRTFVVGVVCTGRGRQRLPAAARPDLGHAERRGRGARRPDGRRPDADRRCLGPRPRQSRSHARRDACPTACSWSGSIPPPCPSRSRRHRRRRRRPRRRRWRRRFGTDGIRGAARRRSDAELALRPRSRGWASARRVRIAASSSGRTRAAPARCWSAALAAGLASVGTDAVDLGVVTTPCLVHRRASTRATRPGSWSRRRTTRRRDNGLKVVVGGRKVDDEVEDGAGARSSSRPSRCPAARTRELGRIRADREAGGGVSRATCARSPATPSRACGIGIDCANGSASDIAPDLFRSLGAQVTVLFDAPNGTNINDGLRLHPPGAPGRAGAPRPASTWASPSMATPIGSSRSTSAASSSTATG